MKVVRRVYQKSSHHKGKHSFILYLDEMMDVHLTDCGNHFTKYTSQNFTIILSYFFILSNKNNPHWGKFGNFRNIKEAGDRRIIYNPMAQSQSLLSVFSYISSAVESPPPSLWENYTMAGDRLICPLLSDTQVWKALLESDKIPVHDWIFFNCRVPKVHSFKFFWKLKLWE